MIAAAVCKKPPPFAAPLSRGQVFPLSFAPRQTEIDAGDLTKPGFGFKRLSTSATQVVGPSSFDRAASSAYVTARDPSAKDVYVRMRSPFFSQSCLPDIAVARPIQIAVRLIVPDPRPVFVPPPPLFRHQLFVIPPPWRGLQPFSGHSHATHRGFAWLHQMLILFCGLHPASTLQQRRSPISDDLLHVSSLRALFGNHTNKVVLGVFLPITTSGSVLRLCSRASAMQQFLVFLFNRVVGVEICRVLFPLLISSFVLRRACAHHVPKARKNEIPNILPYLLQPIVKAFK